MEEIIIEIYVQGKWHEIASVEVAEPKKSSFSATNYKSNLEYFFQFQEQEDKKGKFSSSCLLPLSPTNTAQNHWPSFLLDLMPQGSARVNVCKRKKFVDSQENDFQVLKYGALNPIGNIRVKTEEELFNSSHPGFEQKDILEKNEMFLEHAMQFGAIIVGTSGTQGMAPKFLVNLDKKNKWHCDGAIKDSEVHHCYLAKMPRGKTEDDKLVLKNEEKYLKLAKELGFKSINEFYWKEDILFVERFDRKTKDQFIRYGVESLSSVAGQYQFGISLNHEEALAIIESTSTNKQDLFEYVARDFLNIVMGNTDNHTRNTAFLKYDHQRVELSPIYDFAPMSLDPELIARSCRWQEELANIPNFNHIREELLKYRNKQEVDQFFRNWKIKLEMIPSIVENYQIEQRVIDVAMRSYEKFKSAYQEFIGQL